MKWCLDLIEDQHQHGNEEYYIRGVEPVELLASDNHRRRIDHVCSVQVFQMPIWEHLFEFDVVRHVVVSLAREWEMQDIS